MPSNEPNEAAHEWAVLSQLLDARHPWSVDEMVRSRENANTSRLDTIDAINRLRGEGLVRETGCGLLFHTRAAVYLDRMVG
jgi:hypothetical protein